MELYLMQSPSQSLKELLKVSQKIAIETKNKIEGDLIKTAPVDTRRFKNDWDSKLVGKNGFSVYNTVPYGAILAGGRRQSSTGKMIGSIQWRQGIKPMVKDWEKFIQQRFKDELT